LELTYYADVFKRKIKYMKVYIAGFVTVVFHIFSNFSNYKNRFTMPRDEEGKEMYYR
jgi:hypothetical protein